jgi:hypothetical protein
MRQFINIAYEYIIVEHLSKVKAKISLFQVMEAHRVARG